jgi:hypothetical protein
MNYANSSKRVPLSSSYDFLDASSKCSQNDIVVKHICTGMLGDDEEQASSSKSNGKVTFDSPMGDITQGQQLIVTPEAVDEDQSLAASSWTSFYSRSQASSWTSFYSNNKFKSKCVSPWVEDKPFDEESIRHSQKVNESVEAFHDDVGLVPEHHKEWSDSIALNTSRNTNRFVHFCTHKVEIPIVLAYPMCCLVVSLVVLGFIIGFKFDNEFGDDRTNALAKDPFNYQYSVPVRPPTSVPTSIPTSSLPSVAPATSPSTECTNKKLSVDRACYAAGNDEIFMEFDICEPQESDWIGIYQYNTKFLVDDFKEWSWSCGTKYCRASPRTNGFFIDTGRLLREGTYRAFYIRYEPNGPPFESIVKSEAFEIASKCEIH